MNLFCSDLHKIKDFECCDFFHKECGSIIKHPPKKKYDRFSDWSEDYDSDHVLYCCDAAYCIDLTRSDWTKMLWNKLNSCKTRKERKSVISKKYISSVTNDSMKNCKIDNNFYTKLCHIMNKNYT